MKIIGNLIKPLSLSLFIMDSYILTNNASNIQFGYSFLATNIKGEISLLDCKLELNGLIFSKF